MKIVIDTESKNLECVDRSGSRSLPLYSDQAFDLLSLFWLKVGWNQKYPYTFSWMGRPIIQAPEDIVRTQEVIYRVKPDLLIETGVAHGGSLIFYASLFQAMGKGRVLGVDIDIRPPNRKAIEAHPLSSRISLLEGSSTDSATVKRVREQVRPGETVMVILDSNHTKQHVLEELALYHDLVTPGSYIVATDGSMKDLHDVPRGKPEWIDDNPSAAAMEFAAKHPQFIMEQPPWPFNESTLLQNITHWPNAWLRRR